jgi:hypothetical protein
MTAVRVSRLTISRALAMLLSLRGESVIAKATSGCDGHIVLRHCPA